MAVTGQVLHEVIREHALSCWADVSHVQIAAEDLAADPRMIELMDREKVLACLHADDYVGDAPKTRDVDR